MSFTHFALHLARALETRRSFPGLFGEVFRVLVETIQLKYCL